MSDASVSKKLEVPDYRNQLGSVVNAVPCVMSVAYPMLRHPSSEPDLVFINLFANRLIGASHGRDANKLIQSFLIHRVLGFICDNLRTLKANIGPKAISQLAMLSDGALRKSTVPALRYKLSLEDVLMEVGAGLGFAGGSLCPGGPKVIVADGGDWRAIERYLVRAPPAADGRCLLASPRNLGLIASSSLLRLPSIFSVLNVSVSGRRRQA
nr:hypothetical protein Iba_chr04aCG12820 [Ipomoea batatas]